MFGYTNSIGLLKRTSTKLNDYEAGKMMRTCGSSNSKWAASPVLVGDTNVNVSDELSGRWRPLPAQAWVTPPPPEAHEFFPNFWRPCFSRHSAAVLSLWDPLPSGFSVWHYLHIRPFSAIWGPLPPSSPARSVGSEVFCPGSVDVRHQLAETSMPGRAVSWTRWQVWRRRHGVCGM